MSKKAKAEVADESADTVMDEVLSENQAKLNKLISNEKAVRAIKMLSQLLNWFYPSCMRLVIICTVSELQIISCCSVDKVYCHIIRQRHIPINDPLI